MTVDLDKSGRSFQRSRVWLGPSLGWAMEEVQPEVVIAAAGTYVVQPGDSVILVNVAGAVTVQLPDITKWVQQTANQPATAFDRSITIKDFGGNAGSFPISVAPFGTQKVDNASATITISANTQAIRLVPLNDLSGWFLELSSTGGGGGGGVDWVNVVDFGADPTNAIDSTVAIQAAIDHALATGIGTVYIPSGTYALSDTIYMDPPNNIRKHHTSIETVSFSLCLRGDSDGTNTGYGTRLGTGTLADRPAIIVGPGQNMAIENMDIVSINFAYRNNLPTAGIGIAYTGFGGASQSRTENVQVENYNIGFTTGYLGDGLNDSNTWIKCRVYNANLGWYISQSQNFINSMYDCTAGSVTNCVTAYVGGMRVFGGNFSAVSMVAAGLPVSGISTLTSDSGSWTFTATVTPDAFIPNIYRAFNFETTHFGIIPATMTAWNAGTNQATFRLLDPWVAFNYGNVNIPSTTNLQTELQAATKVFACELPITFQGNGISVIGVHVENNLGPTTLIKSQSGFGAHQWNYLRNIFCNWDPSSVDVLPLSGATDANKSKFYTSANFPFIDSRFSYTHISDSFLGLSNSQPVPVDVNTSNALVIDRCTGGFQCNLRPTAGGGANALDQPNCAIFDQLYLLPGTGYGFRADIIFVTGDIGVSPYWGVRPAGWCQPCVSPGVVTTLSGVLPAISPGACPYPLVWGGQVYTINEFTYSGGANHRMYSNHHWYSYGQNLTTSNISGLSWSYIGQSNVVFVDANTMKMMRPGLGIKLNDGSSDIEYIVTAIFPGLGYIYVSQSAFGASLTSGTKTTVVTGTLIKQAPYVITQLT